MSKNVKVLVLFPNVYARYAFQNAASKEPDFVPQDTVINVGVAMLWKFQRGNYDYYLTSSSKLENLDQFDIHIVINEVDDTECAMDKIFGSGNHSYVKQQQDYNNNNNNNNKTKPTGWREKLEKAQDSKACGDDQQACVVCLDRARKVVLDPCGHVILCATCAKKLVGATCPVCRAQVKKIIVLIY